MEIDPVEEEEQQMFASIIIPTKDEPTIQELVDSINAVIKQNHEILIIDKSLTTPVVKGAKVMIQRSNGLGNAFLEGLSCSRGDIIALMDGDGSHRPEDLQRMLRLIENRDIVLDSKLIDGGECNDAWARRLVTVAFARLTRLILGMDLKDPMTGFMVAKRDVFDDLELKPKGFKIVIEIVYKSRVEALEVPISFCERKAGSSKVGFNMNGLQEMVRIFKLLCNIGIDRNRVKHCMELFPEYQGNVQLRFHGHGGTIQCDVQVPYHLFCRHAHQPVRSICFSGSGKNSLSGC